MNIILCSLGLFQGRILTSQLFPCDETWLKQTRLPHDEACFYWSHLTFGEAYTKMKPPATAGRFSAWPRGQDREGFMSHTHSMRLVDLPTRNLPVLFSSSYMWANIPCMDDHGWYGRGKGTNVGKSDLENIVYHFFGHCSWFYIGVKFMEIISNSFSRAILKS